MTRIRYKICRMKWCSHFGEWLPTCTQPDELYLPECFQEYNPMTAKASLQQRITTGLVSFLAGAAMALAIVSIVLALGCTTVVEQPIELRPCDPTLGTSSTSTDTSTSSTDAPPLDCPTIADGMVAFDLPLAGVTRSVYFDGVAEATGVGPAVIGIHGTYESGISGGVPTWLGYNPGSDLLSMASAQGGIMLALIDDPAASARSNNPFPWWPVCSATYGTSCDRQDDFELVEVATTCALEQGLADPHRVVAGGMSAGGILTSLLVEHDLGAITLAGAVSWSGGTPPAFQPTTPTHAATSVFVLHGGTTDVYCGIGQPAGTCSGYEPYHFDAPSELMASQLDDAGNFAFVCNHGGGHNAQMGGQGAEFLSVARSDAAHPWEGFPFGVDGYAQWPSMSGGTNWMLRFYGDCRYPM